MGQHLVNPVAYRHGPLRGPRDNALQNFGGPAVARDGLNGRDGQPGSRETVAGVLNFGQERSIGQSQARPRQITASVEQQSLSQIARHRWVAVGIDLVEKEFDFGGELVGKWAGDWEERLFGSLDDGALEVC